MIFIHLNDEYQWEVAPFHGFHIIPISGLQEIYPGQGVFFKINDGTVVILIHGTVYNQGRLYKVHAGLLMDMAAQDHGGAGGFNKVQQILTAGTESMAHPVTNTPWRRMCHQNGLRVDLGQKRLE